MKETLNEKEIEIIQGMIGSEGILDLEAINRLSPQRTYDNHEEIYLLACSLLNQRIKELKQDLKSSLMEKEAEQHG